MNLNERAMLVNLHVSMWSATRTDPKVAAEIAARHGAKSDTGRYSKFLIDRKHLEPISKKAGEARQEHYRLTLPWANDGARILPSRMYHDYTSRMNRFREEFEELVDAFAGIYYDLKRQAKVDLNGLYNEADYPADITAKFRMHHKVLPVPTASDFRVDLANEEIDSLKRQMEATMRETTAAAMADCWERLHTVISNVSERLNDPKAIFRDSLIGNVRDLIDILPALNIAGDPKLMELTERARRQIARREPEHIRNDYIVRQDVAREADAILAAMAGYIGAQNAA